MEQKVRICLQFSNPNQGGGPPSSANPLRSPPPPPQSAAPPPSRRRLRSTRASVPLPTSTPPPSANIPRHDARGTNTSRETEGDREREGKAGATKAPAVELHIGKGHLYLPKLPSPTRRPYTHPLSYHFIFPHFSLRPLPRAVSFRQTRSLPNYLPVLAPNAFVKR